ncbi:hypothetical protein Efla_002280 [Eimeria flavescens]
MVEGDLQTPLAAPGAPVAPGGPGAPRLLGGPLACFERPLQKEIRAAEDLSVAQQTDKQQVCGLVEHEGPEEQPLHARERSPSGEGVKQRPRSRSSSSHKAAAAAAQAATTR